VRVADLARHYIVAARGSGQRAHLIGCRSRGEASRGVSGGSTRDVCVDYTMLPASLIIIHCQELAFVADNTACSGLHEAELKAVVAVICQVGGTHSSVGPNCLLPGVVVSRRWFDLFRV